MTDVQASLKSAVAAINDPTGNLYDVTIICTTDDHQGTSPVDKVVENLRN